jgi:glycosyltransferase involved in cell wall biosynthesis
MIGILSSTDIVGGASRAAFRLNRALNHNGIPSTMFVHGKSSDCGKVVVAKQEFPWLLRKSVPFLESLPVRLCYERSSQTRSLGCLGVADVRALNREPVSVFNVHWINGGFMSVRKIGRLRKPVVLTLHDMWYFNSLEHYSEEGSDAPWRTGVFSPKLRWQERWLSRLGAGLKMRYLKHLRFAVTPSNWLTECARSSVIMRDWDIRTIPNPVNVDVFRPLGKELARSALGLPKEKKIILFGATGGTQDPRKGWDLLSAALQELALKSNLRDSVCAVIFGESAPQEPPRLGFPMYWLGRLHDETSLALAYSAADVVLAPSRQDNLPQCAVEAQCCGCNVVGFHIGGLPDIVEHLQTGYLARPFETSDLAHGIEWALHHEVSSPSVEVGIRNRAVELFSEKVVAGQYRRYFEEVLQSQEIPRK